MRVIKFRFWLAHTKKMTYSHYLGEVHQIIPFFTPDIITLQYTGIKDINGTEVYEGDVLCFPKYEGTKHQTRWVMSWNEERAAWSDYSPREKAQVIGNIYENPDLLPNLCSLYE